MFPRRTKSYGSATIIEGPEWVYPDLDQFPDSLGFWQTTYRRNHPVYGEFGLACAFSNKQDNPPSEEDLARASEQAEKAADNFLIVRGEGVEFGVKVDAAGHTVIGMVMGETGGSLFPTYGTRARIAVVFNWLMATDREREWFCTSILTRLSEDGMILFRGWDNDMTVVHV